MLSKLGFSGLNYARLILNFLKCIRIIMLITNMIAAKYYYLFTLLSITLVVKKILC